MTSSPQACLRDDLFKQTIFPILGRKQHYLSQDDLERLGITLKHLDLTTGDIDHVKGTARLVPMPAATIQQILDAGKATRLIQEGHRDIEVRDEEDWDPKEKEDFHVRFYEADDVFDLALAYNSSESLATRANWRIVTIETAYLHRVDEDGVNCYQIQAACEPFDEPDKLDKNRPYIMGYQIDRNCIVDNKLLTSELNALIVLATKYDLDPAYAGCDEFIITIFTGSDRQVRLAQSRVNLASKTFDVSLSRIMDFDNQIANNWEDWKTLLGWFACSTGPRARES